MLRLRWTQSLHLHIRIQRPVENNRNDKNNKHLSTTKLTTKSFFSFLHTLILHWSMRQRKQFIYWIWHQFLISNKVNHINLQNTNKQPKDIQNKVNFDQQYHQKDNVETKKATIWWLDHLMSGIIFLCLSYSTST